MLKVSFSLLLLLCFNVSFAQQLFDSHSKIEVVFNEKNETYFKVNLIKGQGIKGLPEITNKSGKEILKFNNISTEKPVFKKDIMVPLNLETVIKSEAASKSKKVGMLIPVYYKVRKGETIFKIAKTYNNEDVAQFSKRNKLKSNDLKVGSSVLLGWLPLQKNEVPNTVKGSTITTTIPAKKASDPKEAKIEMNKLALNKELKKDLTKKTEKPLTIVTKDTLKKVVLTPEQEELLKKEQEKWVTNKGIAIWKQSHKKNNNKYVLHNKAPINSMILLYNPMVKKSISAKVIGRIPQETYHSDVDIILSSGAANSLGALDSRLMIEMKYKN
jgi:LysM repeat protein